MRTKVFGSTDTLPRSSLRKTSAPGGIAIHKDGRIFIDQRISDFVLVEITTDEKRVYRD